MSEDKQTRSAEQDLDKHFPNTAKLIQERNAKSESPGRTRAEDDAVAPTTPVPTAEEYDDDEQTTTGTNRLESRLQKAAIRREQLLDERRQTLASASAQRKAKLEQVAAMRKEAVNSFIRKAPALLEQLRAAGLSYSAEQTADLVEHVLVADPRVCVQCADTTGPLPQVCPKTKKPHRRSLVVCAETLLKLIGDTKVNLSLPKITDTTQSLDAQPAKPVAKRGIVVLPHLFVLAYYYAAMDKGLNPVRGVEAEVDPLLKHTASHLVEVVHQIYSLLQNNEVGEGQATDDTRVSYVTDLLASFAKTWRQYAKLAQSNQESSPPTPESRKAAIDELIQSTTDAFVSARVNLATKRCENVIEQAALESFLQLLMTRLREIGGPSACEAAMTRAENKLSEMLRAKTESAASDSTPPLTPERRPMRSTVVVPPAPLSSYATSSDTDREPQTRPAQPEGYDRPPAQLSPEEERRELRDRLELRARTAFQTKLKIVDPPTQQERDNENFVQALREAAFVKLAEDLNQTPPVLDKLPAALGSVADALLEALPKRLRSRIGKEVKDVLDWSAVRRSVTHNEQHIAELMKYVVGRVIELGAPAREEELQRQSQELVTRLNRREEHLGDIVSAMFRFMLDSIKQLKLDISTFTLNMVSNELVQHAEEYHTEFLQRCLPPPTQWTRTMLFFQDQMCDATNFLAVKALAEKPEFHSVTALIQVEKYLRAALFLGVIKLLRSSNRTGADRWSLFPVEAFTVEKQQIFVAANNVQQDTIRLMISGTVSMLIQPKIACGPQKLQNFIVGLDRKLYTELLPQVNSLAELQVALQDAVSAFLCEDGVCATPTILSDGERNVLNGVVSKMTDTSSPQYVTFENRVLSVLQQALFMDTKEAQSVPVEQRAKTIGLVSESTFKCGAQLRCVLDYHWNVLRPFYVALAVNIQALAEDGGKEAP